jgi:hypothetical protein
MAIWGSRRASEIAVMTPFVGSNDDPLDPVVKKLLEIPRTREAVGSLIVPGRQSETDTHKMLVNLPRRFLQSWAAAWRVTPQDVPTYVVPPCREKSGEKINRDLHAKGIFVADDSRAMLLCGSSNFSSHGMGVGVANIEANLCYLDEADIKRGGLRLEDRLPVDWDADYASETVWPETAVSLEEDAPQATPRLPAVFLWATYNQRAAELTIGLDPKANPPSEWSIRLPGESEQESLALIDYHRCPTMPEDGRLTVQLPDTLRGATITGLQVSWADSDHGRVVAFLPVQGTNLLPPEEFRALTADSIIACLLSGREVAEWIEGQERRQSLASSRNNSLLDSLRAVETSGYLLYRARRFGKALATLSERLLRTVRTRNAWAYRLNQDPLGPCQLTDALLREWETLRDNGTGAHADPTAVLFALAEVALAVARVGQHVCVTQRVEAVDLRPLFSDVIARLNCQCMEISRSTEVQSTRLLDYVATVQSECERLVGSGESGGAYAG